MKNNFDRLTDRYNTNAIKYYGLLSNDIALTIADMDFPTSEEIISEIIDKAKLGVFGYSYVPEEFYNSIIEWQKKKHQVSLDREMIIHVSGVIPAICTIIKTLSCEKDNVVILSPVYNMFYNCINSTNRQVLTSNLLYSNYTYTIDFIDLENKLKDEKTKLLILCNPHNPIGRIWNKEEIEKIGQLCIKYNVKILSDEIHNDITNDCSYVPLLAVDPRISNITVCAMSASKAFNLAGLHTAYVVCPNKDLKKSLEENFMKDGITSNDFFGPIATIAAYQKSQKWLEEVCQYIFENKKIICDFLKKEISEIVMIESKATYLIWVDCHKITDDTSELCEFLKKEEGLIINAGKVYGENGKAFVRMNVAYPKVIINEALQRLKRGIKKYIEK